MKACQMKLLMRTQSGAVLITALMFLTVLTLIGVVSMQTTSLDYRMSSNAVFKDRAMTASENARTAVASVIDDHLFERGWTSVVMPTGVVVVDAAKQLYVLNDAGESLASTGSLTVDLTHTSDANSSADVMVYKTQTKLAAGAGVAMISGYEGLGKAAASGGANVYFELRSRGKSTHSAQATTATEYRAILKN
jgi:Tfp pilus assembly protein PilX